ncbi:MAG: hypothetical protein RMZ41_031380 [Nostoc sp. DedVER02]|nr:MULTISPECIES: hypothetical protein [unclassified Nostoc]MDZ7989539.1 hypothetical protein [Nostoc sp. DedVER02]MDZ8116084.1 hypothetical protein [Nostoc sp. DedVER01b]
MTDGVILYQSSGYWATVYSLVQALAAKYKTRMHPVPAIAYF